MSSDEQWERELEFYIGDHMVDHHWTGCRPHCWGSVRIASSAPRPHWLLFDKDRQIVGCRCGFRADMDSDCGWGDSVVEHLLGVPR